MNEAARPHVSRYLAYFGPIGALGGFVSDVIQPLAPLSAYVFWVSFAASMGLIVGWLVLRALRTRLLPPLVLAASFLVFSGALLLFQTKESEAKGVLATNFAFVAELQQTLGMVQKDVAEIKETTRKTAEAVSRVEDNTKSIAQSNKQIATSLEAIKDGFASLDKSGGIIRNAQKPEEHYHNARLYEQNGDFGNARRSYSAFFAFKLNFLDPHLRYQTFLKVQEGRAGAREIYGAMYEQDQRPLIDFVRILLIDPPQRLDLLKRFLAANPEFAPGYYELSQEYSAARKGTQSLGEKQAELQALERFKALDAQGKLVRYFMDQTAVAAWLDDADKRLKSLALLKQFGGGPAPALSAMRSNSDWMITLTFKEIPKEVFYKLEGDDSFRSLGFMEYVNPGTGLKTPKTFFNLRPTAGKTMMEIKYTDIGDETRGPFALVFDPAAELLSSHKKVLDQTKNGWVQFAANGDKVLLHFSQLASWRCAIDKVAYGIDTDATPRTFPLEPCDPKNPNVVKGQTYIEVPAQTRYASVRVTYKDGTRSETVRIER